MPAFAGSPCSNGDAYPEVSALRVEDGRLVALLGTHFAEKRATKRPDGSDGYVLMLPQLSMSMDGEWQADGVAKPGDWANRSSSQCLVAPRDPQGAWAAVYPGMTYNAGAEDYYEQSIHSCASDGKSLWGGTSFYGGEGYWGAGRLVRKDLKTGDVEFIRLQPKTVSSGSIGPLAYFADKLWMGTYWDGECSGPAPGAGMRRLYRSPYLDYAVAENVPEVCGFAIRDFQEFDGALWAATELGLSRLTDEEGPVWSNFVPDLDDPALFRELSCDELYIELLSSEEFANVAGLNVGNAFDAFWKRLSVLRPGFTVRYLRKLHGHATEDYPQGH
ncbi:MAG: hypothetical protein AAGF72_02080 [Pseudomonadota bacterium]